MSISLSSISSRSLMDHQEGESFFDSSSVANLTHSFNTSTLGKSNVSRLARPQESYVGAVEVLYGEFILSIQEMTSSAGILQVMTDWKENLENKFDWDRASDSAISEEVYEKIQSVLRKEQQTWNLILQLYSSRHNISEMNSVEPEPFNQVIRDEFHFNELESVKRIADSEKMFKENAVILNWLESNYGIGSYDPDLASKAIMWEQTLQILKRDKLLNKSSVPSLVKCLDSDAPTRENKKLHALDEEEEIKVMKGAYFYLRQGKPVKCREYLQSSGHHMKAGVMFGGSHTRTQVVTESEFNSHALNYIGVTKENLRDFDPKTTVKPGVFTILRGNRTRDLWKKTAWQICESKGQSKYERACLGSLCGHRQAMLDVSHTWEDKLWAYLKASYDVTIEERLRTHTEPNNYIELPDEYWAQGLTLAECLNRLESKTSVTDSPDHIYRVVQQSVMTENINGLLKYLDRTVSSLLQNDEHPLVQSHIVRFLTHLLLALGIMNLGFDETLNNKITEAYIKVLVKSGRFVFIPFYVQKLTENRQIAIIVEQIDSENNLEADEINDFQAACHANSLDILSIGTSVVEKLRLDHEDFKIEWLLWISNCCQYVDNTGEVMLTFLKFVLILARKYLILENLVKVKLILNEVSPDCINEILSVSDQYEDTLVREYICYKLYVDAEDYVKMWTRTLACEPSYDQPPLLQPATLSDKTLWDTKRREFKVQKDKWKRNYVMHTKIAIEKLMDVLKFPKGWLIDCCDEQDTDSMFHINSVRSITIKRVTFMLLKLLQEKKEMSLVRDFCSVLCNKRQQVLKEFMKHEVGTIFKTVEEFTRRQSSNLITLPK